MKKLLLSMVLILCYSVSSNGQVKNLDQIPQPKRDSVILEITKKAMLKYAVEFYEKDKIPTIKRVISEEGVRRILYIVSYKEDKEYYDKYPNAPYLAQIRIWEDTGLVYLVMLQGMGICDLDKNPEHEFFKKVKRKYLNRK